MRLLKTRAGLATFLHSIREHNSSGPQQIGLVPTMGALHAGHLALIHQARQECEIVITSIFVNPLQFSPQEDLARYPRNLEQDCDLCQQAGVDVVFAPSVAELYPASEQNQTLVTPPPELTTVLCGRSRPGHFQGVATVVLKLFNLVQPQRAYFGEKDAQQLVIIRRLVHDLNLPIRIVAVPIVRETSGLALSSRNQYLSPAEYTTATSIYAALSQAQHLFRQGIRERERLLDAVRIPLSSTPDMAIDYVDLVAPESLAPINTIDPQARIMVAVKIGTTRLIDNCLLDARPPILAIDGPAGAGKSTVTRQAAQALGLLYLDTGAMYRAVTWWLKQTQVDLADGIAVAEAVSQCQITFAPNPDPNLPPQVLVNDQDVTQAIRTPAVTQFVSQVAAQPAVRKILVEQQQSLGRYGGVAAEGRDIGTHVFPQAGLKIFLTASVEERARRRWQELQGLGTSEITLEALQAEISQRDYTDQHRAYAPFRPAPDAIELLTDHLSIAEVTAEIVKLYQSRFSPLEF